MSIVPGAIEQAEAPADLPDGTGVPTRRPSYVKRLMARPVAWLSVGWLLIVIIVSVGAPLLAPYGSNEQNLTHLLAGPSWQHLLGTDEVGRDILSRLMYGGLLSLAGTAWATLVAVAIGSPIGLFAGYLGGWRLAVAGRLADLLFAVPGLILLLAVVAIFGSSVWIAMGVLGVILAAPFIRLVAVTAQAARRELYVDAATVSGLPQARVVTRHVLPNIAAPLVIQIASTLAFALMVETGLGFLGQGPQPPTPSWGGMVASASTYISADTWMLVPTGLVLILSVLSLNFIGDAVRDANPGSLRHAILPSLGGNQLRRKGSRAIGTPPPANDPVGLLRERRVTSTSSLIEVERLQVAFPAGDVDNAVVDGVSFTVYTGETLGLVGESGSGKTITALALLGLVPPPGHISGGTVRFGGVELTSLSERGWNGIRGSRIGYIAQEPMVALDPSFTIGSQLVEPIRRHHNMSRREARQRALELLAMVEIPRPDAIFRSYPHELSGGMAQRVVIAIALCGEPELLIADEPTTALDVTVQGEILDLLSSLKAQLGMALILVTHDLGVVADICDRSLVMYAGQIVEEGSVDELFLEPLHPYTRGLLESAPERGQPGSPLPTIRGAVALPSQWPTGCRFAPRCPFAIEDCSAAPVPMFAPATGRLSRCIRVHDLVLTSVGAAGE